YEMIWSLEFRRVLFRSSGGVSSGVNHLECKLASGSFATCTSPQSFPVTEGSHTFQVRAVDNAGNVGDAVSYTWTVDATAPTASIVKAATQADPTRSSPIHFSVTFSEPVTGFSGSGVQTPATA